VPDAKSNRIESIICMSNARMPEFCTINTIITIEMCFFLLFSASPRSLHLAEKKRKSPALLSRRLSASSAFVFAYRQQLQSHSSCGQQMNLQIKLLPRWSVSRATPSAFNCSPNWSWHLCLHSISIAKPLPILSWPD